MHPAQLASDASQPPQYWASHVATRNVVLLAAVVACVAVVAGASTGSFSTAVPSALAITTGGAATITLVAVVLLSLHTSPVATPAASDSMDSDATKATPVSSAGSGTDSNAGGTDSNAPPVSDQDGWRRVGGPPPPLKRSGGSSEFSRSSSQCLLKADDPKQRRESLVEFEEQWLTEREDTGCPWLYRVSQQQAEAAPSECDGVRKRRSHDFSADGAAFDLLAGPDRCPPDGQPE